MKSHRVNKGPWAVTQTSLMHEQHHCENTSQDILKRKCYYISKCKYRINDRLELIKSVAKMSAMDALEGE